MARSHKERHQWKDKERQREGEDDPAKIQLHRERFLARLEARKEIVEAGPKEPSGLVGMHLRLLTIPDPVEPKTLIFRDGKEIGSADHWAVDPSDVEYVIAGADGIKNLDAEAERQRLQAHVEMVQERGIKCHLEVMQPVSEAPESGSLRLCESCFPCSFRTWSEELSLPVCERPSPDK